MFTSKLLNFQKPKAQKIFCMFYSTDTVRVRFAPSPTGFLHLGGLRTALYNFLFARKHDGKFILRIEDTDQTRLVKGAAEKIHEDLLWSGIEIDEGPFSNGEFGPYVQSERLNLYRVHAQTLLETGSAYHCFCNEKRLDLLRREALRVREIPKYDNRCRYLTPADVETRLGRGEQSCIRFKLTPGIHNFRDLIYGTIAYDIALNEGDPVILKTDGYPTYHFANVVDDYFMNITHVLRGVEWQISTTKHLLLYKAFNWEPPRFGHLPLLMNADGSKLSKRQGDIMIGHYRDSNIFPLALINFIVHSGGGFTKDLQHIKHVKPKCYTMEELTEQFDINRINSHSGKLMTERLLEFNKLELKRRLDNHIEEKSLIKEVKAVLKDHFKESYSSDALQISDDHIRFVLQWASNRISKLSDLVSKDLIFLWTVPTEYNVDPKQLEAIKKLTVDLDKVQKFSKDDLSVFLKNFSASNGVKFSNFMKLMRSVLSGLKEGPGVAEMIEILGKENTIHRLRLCLDKNK